MTWQKYIKYIQFQEKCPVFRIFVKVVFSPIIILKVIKKETRFQETETEMAAA